MNTQMIGQNLQQQKLVICSDIKCQTNRILSNWDQLSQHLNQGHLIITEEELINKIKNQYFDIQNYNEIYLQSFKEVINTQFNKWTRSLINQIDKFIDHLYEQFIYINKFRQSEQELYNQIKQVLHQNQVIELEELDKRSKSILNEENLQYLISKYHKKDPYDQYLFEDKIRNKQDQVDIYLSDIQYKLQNMIDDEINNHILFDNYLDNRQQIRQYYNEQEQADGYSNNLDQVSSHSLNDQNINQANSFQSPEQIQPYPINYYQQQQEVYQNYQFQQPDPIQQINETHFPEIQKPHQPQQMESQPQPSLKGYKQLQQAQRNQEQIFIEQPQQQKPSPVYSTVKVQAISEYQVKQQPLQSYKEDNRQNRNNNQKQKQKQQVQQENYVKIQSIDKGLSDNHIKWYSKVKFTCLNNSALVIFKGQITQRQSSTLKIEYTFNKTSKYFMYVGVLDYNLFTRSNLRQPNMPNTYCIDDLGNGYSKNKKEKSQFKLKEKQVITVKYSSKQNQLIFDQGDFEYEIDLRIQQKNELFYFVYSCETTIDII